MSHIAENLGTPPPRHYGLDWLRIAAFAILIGYHSLLPYAPHQWVVSSDRVSPWLAYVTEAISPWRLEVLFLVSGYATQAMLSRQRDIAAFAWVRSRRLLIPLLFGVAVIVPPQSWTALTLAGEYHRDYVTFWTQDYFRFSSTTGLFLPQWQHLWFLGYLFYYTLLFLLYVRLFRLPRWPSLLNRRYMLLILPAAFIAIARVGFASIYGEENHFFDDWQSYLHYCLPFMLGVMLARIPQLWEVVAANMLAAFALGIAAYLTAISIEMIQPDPKNWSTAISALFYMSDSIIAWSIMLGMVGLANRIFNRDHRWRLPLSRAIFPAYILHQTVIVLLASVFIGSSIPALLQWLIIIAVTTICCALAYLLGKLIPAVGLVIGMERSVPAKPSAAIIPAPN
ncbi:acyltransferase family protein [Sphingorhabdus arenilitoris]|uniref:Acyltransferase family protein n=1 Tax=Sphingorhabdus arenilitoris TaxID=1490041 RepID=A0ABV8RDA3_9SPHN